MKGENIFRRKDGRWEARFIRSREESGRIIYGFCYGKTYKEAKEKVSAIKDATPLPARIPRSSQNLGFFCDEWLRTCAPRLKESTVCRYRTAVENHIKPRLGRHLPQYITEETVAGFTSALLDEGLAPKTVKDILIVLRLALKYASKQLPQGLTEPEFSYPKDIKKEARVLSLDEQQRLISALSEDLDACKFGILLAMFTGLRIGELCALKWENISLRDRTIKVSATMQRIKNSGEGGKTKVVIGSPKSGFSARIIPLSEAAVRLCRYMFPGDQAAYILTGARDYIEPRTLQYRLKKYALGCGLEGVHFHTLRHTFATRCVEVGFELKSLSEILGHATTAITMERYVHSSMNLKRENMQKLKAVGL